MSYSHEQNRKARKLARKLNPVVNETPVEPIVKVKKEIPVTKTFRITFTQNSKTPVTRTVDIITETKENAEKMAHSRFGSITLTCPIGWPRFKFPSKPSNKITISSCYLVDSDGNIIPDVVDEPVVVENATTEKPKRSRKKKSDGNVESLAVSEPVTV